MDKVIEIGGETIWDFGATDTDREYFRLLQTSPWSEENARRLADLQPLEDECHARWEAVLAEMCRRPDVVTWQDLAKVEEAEEREPWRLEYLCLISKWWRKTLEGREAVEKAMGTMVSGGTFERARFPG